MEGPVQLLREVLRRQEKFGGEARKGGRHGLLLRRVDGLKELPGVSLPRRGQGDRFLPPVRGGEKLKIALPDVFLHHRVHRGLGDEHLLGQLFLGEGRPSVQGVEQGEGVLIDPEMPGGQVIKPVHPDGTPVKAVQLAAMVFHAVYLV